MVCTIDFDQSIFEARCARSRYAKLRDEIVYIGTTIGINESIQLQKVAIYDMAPNVGQGPAALR